jgi:luciferase family oxidoreductase group 1
MITLGVLDQCPVFPGQTAAGALRETIALAQAAERLGYRRFWVAEHHSSGVFACASPEILISVIAAKTTTIRVGAGGVTLPFYSPLKVAETFRMLHTIFPDRIDLGIGRGPGAGHRAIEALAGRARPDDGRYAEKIREVIGFLTATLPTAHPYADVHATPDGPGSPEIWLLGSGSGGVRTAASLGLPMCFAHFLHARPEPHMTAAYRRDFRRSGLLDRPRASLAVRVLCAEDSSEAARLAAYSWAAMGAQGGVAAAAGGADDGALPIVTGTPGEVKARLLELARLYEVEDLILTTICAGLGARIRVYGLLAEAFELTVAAR